MSEDQRSRSSGKFRLPKFTTSKGVRNSGSSLSLRSPLRGLWSPSRAPSPSIRPKSPPNLISSTLSSTPFQSILDLALDQYSNQTGIDLSSHPSANQFDNCHSTDDVIRILLQRQNEFKDYRDKYRTLIDRIRPVVTVIHAFSNILGGAADFVSSSGPNPFI
jgi:hypothetical protein